MNMSLKDQIRHFEIAVFRSGRLLGVLEHVYECTGQGSDPGERGPPVEVKVIHLLSYETTEPDPFSHSSLGCAKTQNPVFRQHTEPSLDTCSTHLPQESLQGSE